MKSQMCVKRNLRVAWGDDNTPHPQVHGRRWGSTNFLLGDVRTWWREKMGLDQFPAGRHTYLVKDLNCSLSESTSSSIQWYLIVTVRERLTWKSGWAWKVGGISMARSSSTNFTNCSVLTTIGIFKFSMWISYWNVKVHYVSNRKAQCW